MVKVGKVNEDWEQYEKNIIALKERAAKFQKSSKTPWAKAVLQPKAVSVSASATQSIDITKWLRDYLSISLFKLLLLSSKFEIN